MYFYFMKRQRQRPKPSRRLPTLIVLGLIGTIVVVLLARQQVVFASPFMFGGICSHPWDLNERDVQEMRLLGVKYVRMDFAWPDFEQTNNTYTYAMYDAFVNMTKAYNLQIIPLLLSIPLWMGTGGTQVIPPSGPAFNSVVSKFAQFTYNVVSHYKNNITYWEIWNEPDIKSFWIDSEGSYNRYNLQEGAAITKYVMLLNASYTAAKAADPNCKIISAGIANDVDFLNGMYTNHALYDYLGLHPYFDCNNGVTSLNYDVDYWNPSSIYPWSFPMIQTMRQIMLNNGDLRKIIVTEIGIDMNGMGPQGITTEQIQADRLTRIFNKTLSDYPYIQGIMWYQFREPATSPSYSYCLLNADYTYRQAYYAYRTVLLQRNLM